jgi:hypothetical protein
MKYSKFFSVINLNKNICNIIFKYIDYSKPNLLSLLKINDIKKIEMQLKNNMILIDLIVLCIKVGCRGFFIDNINQNAIAIIDYYYSKHQLNESLKIIRESNKNKIFYFIENYTNVDKCINLYELGVFETILI